jgi:mediator of RNA polymerase II transcription subunit 14
MRVTSSLMQVPAIFVKMVDLLPSKNKSPRTGKPWASSTLKIGFRGISNPSKPAVPLPPSLPDQHGAAADTQASSEKFDSKREEVIDKKIILIAESSLLKPMPPGLDLVKRRVDKDIAFHPSSGGFAFRLYSKIGESSIKGLIERLQRVEQLVDFIEVVKKHERTLCCETISLGQVMFSYGGASIGMTEPGQGDAMSVEMSVDQQEKIYHATVDFGGADISLILKRGNPHIRILESLTKVLNSPLGLNGVATLLPLTLPLMTALNAIEDAWTKLDQDDVFIFSRAVDWHIVRYTLNRVSLSGEPQPQKIMFSIRLAHRRREPWWCIRREKERERNENKNTPGPDDIDTALKVVWEDNLDGEQWRGMSTSGIARVTGVEELIGKVDAVIRDYSITTSASQAVAAAVDNVQLTPPIARQQSIQNHNHSQGHMGRNNGIKRETIVID